jgi:alanine racemase
VSADDMVAVGTVYEAADVPVTMTGLVLTPHLDALPPWLAHGTVLTVGNLDHVHALRDQSWRGAVAIKLMSSVRRFGTQPDALAQLVDAAAVAGLATTMYDVHLPLAGTDDDRAGEIEGWLEHLDASVPISVSHLDASSFAALRARHPERTWRIRCGTQLWHADKRLIHLTADVLEARPVQAGDIAGYRGGVVPGDGTIVVIACGSAHGVRALDGGLSPFHFAQRRLALLEPPHMHAALAFVPRDEPCPHVGERVDVQRPLIETIIDELEWLDG